MEKLNLNDLKVAIDDFKAASELMTSVQDTLETSGLALWVDSPSNLHLLWGQDLINIAKICHKTIRLKPRNDFLNTAYFTYRGVTFICNSITDTERELLLETGAIEEDTKGENA